MNATAKLFCTPSSECVFAYVCVYRSEFVNDTRSVCIVFDEYVGRERCLLDLATEGHRSSELMLG